MTTTCDWFNDVVVVNESKEERVPGDVQLFRSEADALAGLEHWWVENAEGFAFTASGVRLVLDVDGDTVFVSRQEKCAEGHSIVLGWLEALARITMEARTRVAGGGRVTLGYAEENGALPTSVEGLIAYIGLPWVPPRTWFPLGCLALLAANAVLLTIVVFALL